MDCKFVERSWIAKVAARRLKYKHIAMVVGNTIHLHGVSKDDFIQNERWLRHEMEHIKQFKQHGFVPFIYKYLLESFRNGYYNNKFEIEARAAEDAGTI